SPNPTIDAPYICGASPVTSRINSSSTSPSRRRPAGVAALMNATGSVRAFRAFAMGREGTSAAGSSPAARAISERRLDLFCAERRLHSRQRLDARSEPGQAFRQRDPGAACPARHHVEKAVGGAEPVAEQVGSLEAAGQEIEAPCDRLARRLLLRVRGREQEAHVASVDLRR